ncbi:MAG: hypothetical protein ACRBCS_02750 [Cellvibrionaceae bacterium]
MVSSDTEFSEAIIFIAQNRVTREMLYSEFEAILDGFIPLPDLANNRCHAVYLRVNTQLSITSAVFFNIKFGPDGHPDKRWNVPLEQLADNSARGPDLGSGPIRLACHSQCCIAWQRQNLWDPDMSPGSNNFVLLRKAISENRLGLRFVEEVEDDESNVELLNSRRKIDELEIEQRLSTQFQKVYEQKFRDRLAQVLKEQRLRILTLNSKRKLESQQLQLTHQQRINEYRDQIELYEKKLTTTEERNKDLKEVVEAQAQKVEGLREYFENKLKTVQLDENFQLQSMQENVEAEVSAKIEAATLDIREQLQMREIELMYRAEQELSLEEEIQRLREENQRLLGNSSEQLLEKLENAGLNFVAYHAGAGHLTVPLEEMSNYLANPVAYVAVKCGVTEKHYREWLIHHKSPTCQALNSRGEVCSDFIERVPTPGQFHPGENDRCDHHRATPLAKVALLRP